MKKFLAIPFVAVALAACGGGGGGGGTATNTDTGEVVTCSADPLAYTVTCGGEEISISDIASMTDNGDGTYTVQYRGVTYVVRPDDYNSTVVADTPVSYTHLTLPTICSV